MDRNENRPGYKKTKVGWVPNSWEVYPFDKYFKRVSKKVDVEPNKEYQEIGIRSHGKGIFHKNPTTGLQIGNKSVFWLEEPALIFNIVFAWEHAVAVTTKKEIGLIASHRFPMYKSLDGRIDLNYTRLYFLSKRGKTAKVGFVQQKDKFSRIIAGQNLKRYILLKKGEFAYNKGNSKTYPQGCVYMLEDFDEAAVPNVYFCFRPRNSGINGKFYKFYFENGLLNHQLQNVINTGVRNDGLLNLNPDDFFNIRIKVPSISEQ